ncbi:hypothetical protein [Xanthomonas sp. GPE 39]|uniref:hypothetical protein n=1 Tax=Xanthomonas sp. GPE 39 TaxID=1583099 RepID=UPI00126A7174|nr:hypothetical protein [Xanthomonas sp. GPE 39]
MNKEIFEEHLIGLDNSITRWVGAWTFMKVIPCSSAAACWRVQRHAAVADDHRPMRVACKDW